MLRHQTTEETQNERVQSIAFDAFPAGHNLCSCKGCVRAHKSKAEEVWRESRNFPDWDNYLKAQ